MSFITEVLLWSHCVCTPSNKSALSASFKMFTTFIYLSSLPLLIKWWYGGSQWTEALIRCDRRQVPFFPFQSEFPVGWRIEAGHKWLFYQLLTAEDTHEAGSHLSYSKHRQSPEERHLEKLFLVCHFCLPEKPLSLSLGEQGTWEHRHSSIPAMCSHFKVSFTSNFHCKIYCDKSGKRLVLVIICISLIMIMINFV